MRAGPLCRPSRDPRSVLVDHAAVFNDEAIEPESSSAAVMDLALGEVPSDGGGDDNASGCALAGWIARRADAMAPMTPQNCGRFRFNQSLPFLKPNARQGSLLRCDDVFQKRTCRGDGLTVSI